MVNEEKILFLRRIKEQVEDVRRVQKLGKAVGGKGSNSERKSDCLPKG